LDADEVLFELKAMIDCAFSIRQDRERCFKRFCKPAGTIQVVTKNDQNLRPGFDELIVHAPQLGDMRAALNSVVLAHEEQDNFLPAIIGKCNLSAGTLREFKIRGRRTDFQFSV
jgi:hypothetical protein